MSGYGRPMLNRGMSHRGSYGRDFYEPALLGGMPRRDGFSAMGNAFPGADPLAVQALVIVIDPERICRAYAEMFLGKLKKVGLICDIVIIDKFTSPSQVIDDATTRGLLYAASVNLQNERHQSVTVNILQGQPQEHRNMPYEDALKLISRNFDAHLLKLGGAKADVNEVPMMPGMEDKNREEEIDPTLSLLLINLAEGKILKMADLDRVINFLNEKRAKLIDRKAQSEKPAPRNSASVTSRAPKPVSPVPTHAENFQARITQLFGDVSKQQSTVGFNLNKLPAGAETKPDVSDSAKKTVGIDFDNPTVKNALQNLMRTGTSILDTIRSSTSSSKSTTSPPAAQAIPTIDASRPKNTAEDSNGDSSRPAKRARPGRHAIAGFY